MKKVLIVCVSYNSYKVLYDYVRSIDKAAEVAKDKVQVVVTVADNTPTNYEEILFNVNNIETKIFPYHQNYGYMGGAVSAIKDLTKEYVSQFDFVIVSNVDITLSEDFFNNLCNREFPNDVAWIAPSIYRQDKSNENPFQVNRISKMKLNILILMYSLPWLYDAYQRFSESRHKEASPNISKEETIFAGMGSIFIFTKKFIENEYPLTFPCFMYGEELYYGELVHKKNMKTLFVPSIEVYDIGAVSTAKLGLTRKCEMNRESLKKVKNLMYE